MKDTAWNKILKKSGKFIKFMWVAYGVHLSCLLLWLLNIIPAWAWVLSILPWAVIASMTWGMLISVGEIEKEEYRKIGIDLD